MVHKTCEAKVLGILLRDDPDLVPQSLGMQSSSLQHFPILGTGQYLRLDKWVDFLGTDKILNP